MKGLLKIMLGLAGAILLLVVAAAVLLPMIYDESDLKQAISSEVFAQTGRELRIDGPLDFSVFPWLAVEVEQLSLGNASGFGDQPLAKIGQARAGVALVPLFRKQISLDEIILDGLELNLAVNEQGLSNWGDLAAASTEQPAPDPGSSPFTDRRVAGLNIRNARVEYRDDSSGGHYRLTGLSLRTGALGGAGSVPVTLTAALEDVTAGARVDVAMTGIVAIDLDTQQYALTDLEMALALDAANDASEIQILAPRVDLDLASQVMELESFSAALSGIRADGALSVQKLLEAPTFSGSLSLAEFSPVEFLQAQGITPPMTADPEVLKRATVRTKLSGDEQQINLSEFILELDQSRFTGQMHIRNLDTPKFGFDLHVDEIDLDRYLEPASDASGAGDEDVAMPKEELQGQEIQGQLSAGKLRLAGLDFSNAELGLLIRNGRLRIHPLTAEFYGGRYSGDINLDGSGDVPVLSLDQSIDSITFQSLVSELVDTESLSGVALGHTTLTGRGYDSAEVLASLNGDIGLTLTEGALEGINIWYEIRRGMALYKGLAPPEAEPNRTVFSRMKLAASVKEGVITTREMIGELPFLTVRGDGVIDLATSRVDLGLVAAVRDVPELAEDPLAAELGGKSVPFRVGGTPEAPTVTVDWEALLKSEATDLLLDQLGLGAKTSAGDVESAESESSSTEDQLEEAAKSAIFDLLGGKDRDKDDGGGSPED
jgi:AsmA protein